MDTYPIKSPRKLIEVALPLEAINRESLRRKQKAPKGWPGSFHKWWAQRPLAAAQAVIFGQLVNDPSWRWELEHSGQIPPNHLKASWAKSRKRLFAIIERSVLWENSTSEEVLELAREEIRRSWRDVCEINRDHPDASVLFNPETLPPLYDPFAGGGMIPIEAQRLNIETVASDLNPVAVIINKALVELPFRFARHAPIGPILKDRKGRKALELAQAWPDSTGLAEDVRRYGALIREEAYKRIGHLYPTIKVTPEMAVERPDLEPLVDQELTIIAWLWARTVRSPSPAFSDVDVPLASTFVFSSKAGKQIFVQPQIEGRRYQFRVKQGTPLPKAKNGTKFEGRGAEFKCIFSDVAISGEYIRTEAKAGRIGQKLMAIAADGLRGRVYLPPTEDAERTALSIEPTWKPDVEFFQRALGFRIGNYGMTTWSDLFSKRQLMALTTLNSVVSEASQLIRRNAIAAGMADDGIGLEAGGTGATAYSEAITVYLACVLDRMIYYGSSLTTWLPKDNALRDCMPRAALAMTWDFAECNPFGKSSGDFQTCLNSVSNYLNVATPVAKAAALQRDAALPADDGKKGIVSTDPPYYDNIGYADLSDYFYVWLRPILRPIFPSLFSTVTTPKADELVATPSRHGGADRAETFFLDGMTSAMRSIVMRAHPAFPVTIYYAFKQSETEIGEGTSSTGWETFLDAVLRAGFFITGTLPMRTEGAGRIRAKESNALNSSIVLVCRVRSAKAPAVSRREFLRELNVILPEALDEMTKGAGSDHSPIAPVDLSQAIIGPGMGVFSKYEAVLEADGSPMSIRVALQLINRFLAQDDFDADTQFCLLWFEQHSWGEGPYGDADKLSRGKGTSVDGMKDAAVLRSGGGKVRLLKWAEYPTDWDPRADDRVPIWEALHQLIRALKQDGEAASGVLLSALGGKADAVRQLAYRLYTLCERLGQAEDARAYNELITSWTGIESAASIVPKPADQQELLF